MATLKTTVSLRSSDMVGAPTLNLNASSTETFEGTQSGQLTISEGSTQAIQVEECGAYGATVYLSAPATNPSATSIKIHAQKDFVNQIGNAEPISSIATLKPGEIAVLQLPAQQKGLLASTTSGTGVLNYTFVNKGGQFGKSAIVVYKEAADVWYARVLDSDLGEVSPAINLGTATGWGNPNIRFVQDSGWVIKFTDEAEGVTFKYHFINSRAELIDTVTLSSDGGFVNDSYYTAEVIVISYSRENNEDGGPIGVGMILFYGDEKYVHLIDDCLVEAPQWGGFADVTTADASTVWAVYGIGGVAEKRSILLINRDQLTTLYEDETLPSPTVNVGAFLYNFGNFIILTFFNTEDEAYETISIYSTEGVLLHEVDVTGMNLDAFEFAPYGSNKAQLIMYSSISNSIDYQLFNFNGTTGTLIGKDLDWSHVRGSFWSGFTIGAAIRSKYYGDGPTYLPESSCVIFYEASSFTTNSDKLLLSSNYIDLTYVIDGDEAPSNYVVTADNLASMSYEFPQAINGEKSGITIYVTDYAESPAPVVTGLYFAKGTPNLAALPTKTFNVIDDIANLTTVEIHQCGVYTIIKYLNSADSKYYIKVISAGTILQTLTLASSNVQINTWYNISRLSDATNSKTYYLNNNTKKYVLLDQYYNNFYDGDFGPNSYGIDKSGLLTNTVLFVKSGEGAPSPALIFKVIKENGVSQSKVIQAEDSDNWTTYVHDSFIAFRDQTPQDIVESKVTFEIYDLNLNLKNSVRVKNNFSTGPARAGDRLYFETDEGSGKIMSTMISPNSFQKFEITPVTIYYVLNDWWWD